MKTSLIKEWIRPLRHTPFHPQWLINRKGEDAFVRLLQDAAGPVLDIGCANKSGRKYLGNASVYIGLDFSDTASVWYETVPDIYADAQVLPFAEQTISVVLLLDVLEHIPDPDLCLAEIHRVLKPLGMVIIQVPFLYPLHDVPLDFRRWTEFGLRRILSKHNLNITEIAEDGNSFETCALLANLSLSRILLWCLNKRHPLVLLAVFIPALFPLINLIGFMASKIFPDPGFMPYRYRTVAIKN